MTDTAASSPPARPSLETLVIGIIVALVLGAGWYLLAQQQQDLRRSPTGLDGLQVWLASNGVSAQNFTGGWLIDQTSVGLLVLPLYDTDLDSDRASPTTQRDLLLQQDEYDLRRRIVLEKLRRVPTLAVLPKWRSGMRLTGLAHPVLHVEPARLNGPLRQITGDTGATVSRATIPFTDFPYRSADGDNLTARIYAAQTFRSAVCDPVIGSAEAMLLADCPGPEGAGRRVLVLADPDLLNNHGLRLGDNAAIALDLMRTEAGERNTIIDYSQRVWLHDPTDAPKRERTWADLARFFGPPFLTLWAGAGLVLALFLWRAARRYGPVRPDLAGPGAGKILAVRARARLLRLSGQDGALVRGYAAARLAATAAALLGPEHARHYAGEAAFLRLAARRQPETAARLGPVLEAIRALPDRVAATEAIHRIDQLEQLLEQLTHDA